MDARVDSPASSSSVDRAAFVLDLAHVDAADLPLVGGKAANLGEMIQAGFPVPPGFAVTTAAYDDMVAANAIDEVIANALPREDGAAIRAAFEQAAMPSAVEDEILSAYRRLGSGSVAVRSSATAEDLPDAAFAGQQDTFLGIVDEQALLAAVRSCWASLWSDRAISYRQKQGFGNSDVKLAAIVQRLIAADAAGVLFTANPITGSRDETVIDASAGLGEAIVSGLVTPDHMVLRKGRRGWRIVERQAGRREVDIRPLASGGTEQVAGDAAAGAAVPDTVLRRLARMGAAIERHFGRPQDIEWALADGKLFALQSRPITALPEPEPRRGRFQFPQNGPDDYFQVRPYPLDMTSWLPALSNAIMNMFPLGNAMRGFEEMFVEEKGVAVRFGGWPSPRITPELLLAPLYLADLAWKHDPARWRDDPILANNLARIHELEGRALQALSWAALVETAHSAMATLFDVMEIRRRYLPRTLFALGGLRLALAGLGQGELFADLLSGVDNKTLEANRALEGLATEIRSEAHLTALFAGNDAASAWNLLEADPAALQFFLHLRQFLDVYGRRETASPLLVSQPTWKDAPEPVLGILKGLALSPPRHRDGEAPWEAARDRVLAHPVFELPFLREAFLNLLTEARRFPSLREDTHFIMTMPMPVLRQTFMEMGRRLTELGILAAPDDVFHLRLDELEQLSAPWPPSDQIAEQLRATTHERAAGREALREIPLMPAPVSRALTAGSDALVVGRSGSPGVAEGPVRIVRDATAFGTLLPGEVLVAPYTNPAWTPLFGRAVAVVVDTGSALSHAAIVAREYGIPAVMGTGDALQRLHDGQRVRVDGTQGVVTSADGAHEPLPVADSA